MLDYGAIGARIRACRKKTGLSQEALAEKVWISTTHMSHIETGSTKLSLAVLSDLSKVLNVSTDELLFGRSPVSDDIDRTEFMQIIMKCSDKQLDCICHLIKNFTDVN